MAPLLSPLFDFTPSTNSLGTLPVTAPVVSAPRPLSASSSYSSIGATTNYVAAIPPPLAPPPIMPGSALRLLNQGRAQGLFTPSTSGLSLLAQGRSSGFNSPGPYQQGGYSQSPHPQTSETPPPESLKRHRSEADVDPLGPPAGEMLYILSSFPLFNLFPSTQIFFKATERDHHRQILKRMETIILLLLNDLARNRYLKSRHLHNGSLPELKLTTLPLIISKFSTVFILQSLYLPQMVLQGTPSPYLLTLIFTKHVSRLNRYYLPWGKFHTIIKTDEKQQW